MPQKSFRSLDQFLAHPVSTYHVAMASDIHIIAYSCAVLLSVPTCTLQGPPNPCAPDRPLCTRTLSQNQKQKGTWQR